MKTLTRVWLLALLCIATSDTHSAGLSYRPGREFRSLNTEAYEISVQRNGRLDVLLANGEPVFTNVFPMVWFDQEDKPVLLSVDGRYSQRFEVNNRLGRGQGMILKKDKCEWLLHAYPSKPYLAVHVAYTNNTKKPVTVKALMPWCVGDPKKGMLSLGEETHSAVSKENTIAINAVTPIDPPYTPGSLAMLNPKTNRLLIAGFLSDEAARTRITVSHEGSRRRTKTAPSTTFRGICEFEPPVVLEPGERVESDVLYLSLTDKNPQIALERFALATISANNLRHDPGQNPYRWIPTSQRPPHDELDTLEVLIGRPAAPVDLFENEMPKIWSLPLGTRADQGHVVALFNNNLNSVEQLQVAFRNAGMDPNAYYTVYDTKRGTYHGIASGALTVAVPAGGVRLISLRRLLGRPMVISIPTPPMQGKRDRWDAANVRLSGTIHPNPGFRPTHILVPAHFTVKSVTSPSGEMEWDIEGNILTLPGDKNLQTPVEWIVHF